jgi:hypothetical protein
LLPTLGLTSFMMQIYATVTDHYMDLPMLGVALAAGWIVRSFQARWPRATYALAAAVLWPRSVAAQTSLARGLIELGRFEDADRVLDIAEAMHPGDPSIAAERELLRRRADRR